VYHLLGKPAITENIAFPKPLVITGNVAVAAWIALDTIAFLLINPVVGVGFLLVALIAVYGVLKFLGCMRPCYNCSKCTFGMGRIAVLYFGKRSLKDYKLTYGLPVALFFYVFLGPFPAAVLFAATVQAFAVLNVAVLVCILALSIVSASTWLPTRKL
jgi:hypothetical protein